MDVFELRPAEFTFGDDEESSAVAAVFINGFDLRALVDEAVRGGPIRQKRPDRVDSVADEWPSDVSATAFMYLDNVAPPSRHWLGDPIGMLSEDGRAAVLECTCGCFPCGGASARITIDAETVTWSNFQEANSPKAIPLRAFRFSRSAYEAALRDVRPT